MRIGLFTDTFHPATNGIVTVVDITRRRLEEAGHEVYVFCPGTRADRNGRFDDSHVIWLPGVPAGIFDGSRLGVFLPRRELRKIHALNLDVLHFLTPTPVGLLGVHAARRTGAVLVGQHCTDLQQYAEHYPKSLPGVLTLAGLLPLILRFTRTDARALVSLYRPRRRLRAWNGEIASTVMAMLYSRCDAVIVLSRKSRRQLEESFGPYRYDMELIPTGVDPLPEPTSDEVREFRRSWGIADEDMVVGYVGRLGAEKNLERVIEAFALLAAERPSLKLLFVGDFNHRAVLEVLARDTGYGDRVIFTGRLPRENLGVAYRTLEVFLFPSVTDTQGLVLHEAAGAGCPLVLVDDQLSEVFSDGGNGLLALDSGEDIADKTAAIVDDPELRSRYSERSTALAAEFSETNQVAKQVALYEKLLAR